MKRSEFLKSGLALLSAGTIGELSGERAFGLNLNNYREPNDLNVMFNLADDLGYNDLG